jgi:hypothetical protein
VDKLATANLGNRISQTTTTSKYKADLAAAEKAGKSQKELFAIAEDSFRDERYIDDEAIQAETSYLFSVAHHLRVPVPDHLNNALWTGAASGGVQRILTESALSDFRAAVCKERNERWQYWELRLKVLGVLLTGLIGTIGTLIGLIAIWRK